MAVVIPVALFALAASIVVITLGLCGGFEGVVGILTGPRMQARLREWYDSLGATPEARAAEFARIQAESRRKRVAEVDLRWMRNGQRGGPS